MDLNVVDIRNKYPRIEKTNLKRKINDIKLLILHFSVFDDNPIEADVFKLLKYFQSKNNHITPGRGLPFPAYHEMMEKSDNDIVFFQISYPEDIVYHVGDWNKECYGIAINQMNYDELTSNEYYMLVERLSQLCIKLNISPYGIFGHRSLKKTGWYNYGGILKLRKNCPGFININVLKNNVKLSLQGKGIWDHTKIIPQNVLNTQYIDYSWLRNYEKYLNLL